MTGRYDWLPPLLRLEDSAGSWESYIDVVYRVFQKDLVYGNLQFFDKPVRVKRLPVLRGKETAFWHLVSYGDVEDERLPDLRRCERIGWVRAAIEHAGSERVKCWQNRRRGEDRYVIWLEDEDFVVILADRRKYVLVWTAYVLQGQHRRDKFRREYERSKKLKPPT